MISELVPLPKELIGVYFNAPYEEPPPPPPGEVRSPEQIELAIKIMEKKLEALPLVTITLPPGVLWFEPPLACLWEDPMKYATKRGARFDEKHKTRRSSVMPAGRQSLLADWVPSDRGQKRRPSTGTPGDLGDREAQSSAAARASVLLAQTPTKAPPRMSLQQRLSIATGEAQAPQDQTRNLLEELLEEPQSETESEESVFGDLIPREIVVNSEPREKFTRTGYWTTKYIHDSKFNEEKQTITFRTSKLGILNSNVFLA
ncbi:uncharacterized protein LOC113370883 [Ctenocephalides felis]|uniref:uncharacterized protein LOC113370883 n=1 Tax=Ctenocephalides felis TaxID=7515 RepID=UPI000E6E59EC|nr:uncharacterized protein LOC113370883 [Ctenocephalides felis]